MVKREKEDKKSAAVEYSKYGIRRVCPKSRIGKWAV